jgi:hypothetical protein
MNGEMLLSWLYAMTILSNLRCHAGSTLFTMIPVQLYLEAPSFDLFIS